MKVKQFHTTNQFVINTEKGEYFQSYDSIIVFIPKNGNIQLDKNKWDYSKTTSKYRNKFLNTNTDTIKMKIQSGEYKLVNLN